MERGKGKMKSSGREWNQIKGGERRENNSENTSYEKKNEEKVKEQHVRGRVK